MNMDIYHEKGINIFLFLLFIKVWLWLGYIGVTTTLFLINPFPNKSFLDGPNFKESADDNWNMAIKVPIARN